MPFALSKSRYCNAVQCPKMLWLHKYMPEEFDESVLNEAVLETGNKVGDLAMGIFGDFTEVPFGDLKEMMRTTDDLMKQRTPVICEASFSYEGLFCSIDILRNLGRNRVELYEVKSSTSIHDIYYDDISYQVYVLTRLGYHVSRACLVHLNKEYVRIGELNLSELFTIEDLTTAVQSRLDNVEQHIAFLKRYMRKRSEPNDPIGPYCFSPYSCGFFTHCSASLPKPNVFYLRNTQLPTKFQYFAQGLISFPDLQKSGKLKKKPALQVKYELEDLPDLINTNAIQQFLNTISYPLYYLDFETFQPAIPMYDYTSPYDQIPFQYSLHYQKRRNGKLYHKEYLAAPNEDPRRNLAEQLCRDIPANACVLAYNMAFEKARIKEMASLFPDLKEHLMAIHANMKDLMIPFQQGAYYNRAMQGSYSIKYVLPALYPNDPELDYHSLDGVHNGHEASDAFLRMHTMDQTTLKNYRRYLLKYCELDTYAMVKILNRLYEVVQ